MSETSTVLLAINNKDIWSDSISELTDEYGYRVLRAQSGAEAISLGSSANVDLVISEPRVGEMSGIDLLRQFRISHPYVIRLFVKARDPGTHQERAIDEAAIYQYIRMPLDPEQTGLVVKRALETRELARRHRLLSRELKFQEDSPFLMGDQVDVPAPKYNNFEKLVYASEELAALCDLARQSAKTELPILIEGETGTGKELLARAVHFNSSRNQRPLLVQNCGGMPDDLLQSELFGHKRGAFTGAICDRLGLFRAADEGTVFLDEISEVSASFQVSLLRFLQEGEVKPLGSDEIINCDVRIIAASNRPLAKLVETGEFRQDLYFRLKGFELTVPPLRSRKADIPVLAEFFAKKYGDAMGGRILGIASDVLEQLTHYPFPGNIRELENEIRRMVAMASEGGYLTMKYVSPEIASAAPLPSETVDPTFDLAGDTLKEKVEALEKQLVNGALRRHRWNQSEAARELGLSRVGLANKIKRYEIDPAA